jgi:hypothetical protein
MQTTTKLIATSALLAWTLGTFAAENACSVRSAASLTPVIELYTSEGCSSCPPADRWLSTLKGRPEVLALAFHVTYWDRLGWVDRYALPEATARQSTLAQLAGAAQVYTPQVVVNGRDWRIWPKLPAATSATTSAAPSKAPSVTLMRDGEQITAQIAAGSGARLAGYWAVLEDGHQSAVKAGENAGETLRHDHVVRLYKPVQAWAAADGLRAQLQVSRGEAAYPRRIVFVVTDAATAQPLQAVSLSC